MPAAHKHRWVEVMYVVSGAVCINVLDEEFLLEGGMYIIIDGDIPHSMTVDQKNTLRLITIEMEGSVGNLIENGMSNCHPYKLLMDSEEELLCLLRPLLRVMTSDSDMTDLLRDSLIHLYLSEILIVIERQAIYFDRQVAIEIDIVDQVVEYILNHHDQQISVTYLANMVHVHPSYLHRRFKKKTELTIQQFITRERIMACKKLLEETDENMLDIAIQVGYNSGSYFSYVFKQQTGLTSKEYRSKRREKERWTVKD